MDVTFAVIINPASNEMTSKEKIPFPWRDSGLVGLQRTKTESRFFMPCLGLNSELGDSATFKRFETLNNGQECQTHEQRGI